jgi:hypothetical protein
VAIGTTAAILGAAAIGAIGSGLSASSQNRATNRAVDATQATARENNALSREFYGNNAARLDPYSDRGLQAGNALSGLLGLPSGPGGNAPATVGSSAMNWGAYLSANPDLAAEAQRVTRTGEFSSPAAYAQWHWQNYGQGEGRTLPGQTAAPGGALGGTATAPASATAAFDTFRNSTNYQFRFNEGNKALQLSALGGGGFDSGATRRSIVEYGQNFASNELGTYMDRLAQQQQFGLGAASALAGVGQNTVSQVSANNNMAGQAAANAALMRGQTQANMYGGIANSMGTAIGALGSSYGR